MKFIRCVFLFVILTILSLSAEEINLLTIGNSFSESLGVYLEKVCESVPDCKLNLGRANHGGCDLKRHWSYVEREESSDGIRLYGNKTASLKEILQSRKWNFISLQQASHQSWIPETFEPYAKNLRDYALKYSPSAEIILQQTWSYRNDDPRLSDFNPETKWKINQMEMYKLAREAYRKSAYSLGLRVVPMGDAVQMFRSLQEHPFLPLRKELLDSYEYPKVPSDDGDVVGSYKWRNLKSQKSASDKIEVPSRELVRDSIHLNRRGEYLQACVWFGFLFDKSPTLIKYRPENMGENEAAIYKNIAAMVLRDSTLPVKAPVKAEIKN